MRRFTKGEKVIAVTSDGIIKGIVYSYHRESQLYVIDTKIIEKNGEEHCLLSSHVYPRSDLGRATNFFRSRYGV